jgi:hypothetical protein
MPNYSYELFDSKKNSELYVFLLIYIYVTYIIGTH